MCYDMYVCAMKVRNVLVKYDIMECGELMLNEIWNVVWTKWNECEYVEWTEWIEYERIWLYDM